MYDAGESLRSLDGIEQITAYASELWPKSRLR